MGVLPPSHLFSYLMISLLGHRLLLGTLLPLAVLGAAHAARLVHVDGEGDRVGWS